MNNILSSLTDLLADSSYFGILLTIGLYAGYSRLCKKVSFPLLNPMLLTMVSIVAVLLLLDIPYEAYAPSGEWITWFLTPATVCFAVPLYRQITALRHHAAAILASIFVGSLTSVASIFLMAKCFGLPEEIHASISPKSVTMPIATSIAGELNGIVGCTVIAVVITGIFGAVFTSALKRLLRIKSDIAWGLATGTSSHAVGTSAVMAENEVAGAMSSLSIALAGIMTVVLVPLLSVFY